MNPTPEEKEAAEIVFKAMRAYEVKKFIGNLLCTLATISSIITPFILSTATGDWTNVFLLILYPFVVFPMSLARHSSLAQLNPLISILIPFASLNIFMSITNAPVWYWIIATGSELNKM